MTNRALQGDTCQEEAIAEAAVEAKGCLLFGLSS